MRAAHLRRLGLLTLVLVSALHCGPAAPQLSRDLSERTVGRLARAPTVYAPTTPGEPATAETAALAATFESSLEPPARARVRHDPVLDLAAAAMAENFSDQGSTASRPLAQWVLWRSGSVAMYHHHSGGFASSQGRGHSSVGSPKLAEWAARAAEYLNATPGGLLSYGLARFTEGRVIAEAIVFGAAPFEVAPFSKTYAPGGPFTLALRPRIPFRELRFSIDTGDAVEEETLAPRPDGSFFVSRPVPSKPGRYFVEVQGPPPLRLTQMILPIYVGVPEPTAPDDFIQHPPAGPADLAGWPAWLAARYDAERARLGKPPVEVDARLSALALERSLVAGAGRRLPPMDNESFSARLPATSTSPRSFVEALTITDGADGVLLKLLRPSVRKRLVFGERVVFGAAASPRPAREKAPPTFALVEEMVTPEAAVPAVPPAPAASAAPAPGGP